MSRKQETKLRPGPDPDFPWIGAEERMQFPDPASGPAFAPLAHGGNLSPGMLLSAYEAGIFPWYNQDDPVLWWSPDPRFVIFPDKIHLSDSMRKVLRQERFRFSFDSAFEAVIRACSASPRPGQDGTWITEDILSAYIELHRLGHAHSVEAWQSGDLVGGLYGVSVGRLFCGESMFSRVSNASKAAFLTLAVQLGTLGVPVIDSQVHTKLFETLGAEHISRETYLRLLAENQDEPLLYGSWKERFLSNPGW